MSSSLPVPSPPPSHHPMSQPLVPILTPGLNKEWLGQLGSEDSDVMSRGVRCGGDREHRDMLMKMHLTSSGEPQGRGVQREGKRTYMAGKVTGLRFMSQNKKRATEWAYLRKYIQVNWGHCTWKIPPGLPGTAAPCLRKRERQMASGLGTGTLPLRDHGHAKEKGRETKT